MPVEYPLDTDDPAGMSGVQQKHEEYLLEEGGGYLTERFIPARGTAARFEDGRVSPINARPYDLPDRKRSKATIPPRKRHETRSQKAQTADESFNAPLAPSYAKWLEQPNRYDFPLVDTIPPERVMARADDYATRALESGVVKKIDRESDVLQDDTPYGRFRSGDRMVMMNPKRPVERAESVSESYGYTFAHEVGHAVDRRGGDVIHEEYGKSYAFYAMDEAAGAKSYEEALERADERADLHGEDFPERFSQPMADRPTLEEMWKLSERARGESDTDYRRKLTEITADALALHQIEPRAVRREYPRAASFLDDLDELAFGWEDGD